MTSWRAQCALGCTYEQVTGVKRPKVCDCGTVFVSDKARSLSTSPSKSKSSTPTRRKRGKSISSAPAQQAKCHQLPCARCGYEGDEFNPIDAAHLTDRGVGGCADPLCVIPLCRRCHLALHAHQLELLPALLDRGYYPELAHAVEAHEVSPATLVRRLTIDHEGALG